MLGSRITTINGDSLEEVLARTAAIQASENLYDRYANLCRSMPTEHFLRQLFPRNERQPSPLTSYSRRQIKRINPSLIVKAGSAKHTHATQ
ncbi:hypothetical protein NIB75_22210 [Bacteroides uniformis]|nr:hypothetical protein [Bacteroides uniformis]